MLRRIGFLTMLMVLYALPVAADNGTKCDNTALTKDRATARAQVAEAYEAYRGANEYYYRMAKRADRAIKKASDGIQQSKRLKKKASCMSLIYLGRFDQPKIRAAANAAGLFAEEAEALMTAQTKAADEERVPMQRLINEKKAAAEYYSNYKKLLDELVFFQQLCGEKSM